MSLWRNAHGKKLHRRRIAERWLWRWLEQMKPDILMTFVVGKGSARLMTLYPQAIASRARMRAGIRRVCKVRRL